MFLYSIERKSATGSVVLRGGSCTGTDEVTVVLNDERHVHRGAILGDLAIFDVSGLIDDVHASDAPQ